LTQTSNRWRNRKIREKPAPADEHDALLVWCDAPIGRRADTTLYINVPEETQLIYVFR
jgi:hypothetical protein